MPTRAQAALSATSAISPSATICFHPPHPLSAKILLSGPLDFSKSILYVTYLAHNLSLPIFCYMAPILVVTQPSIRLISLFICPPTYLYHGQILSYRDAWDAILPDRTPTRPQAALSATSAIPPSATICFHLLPSATSSICKDTPFLDIWTSQKGYSM